MTESWNELKKSLMAFQLKDGNTLFISKEDVAEIAMKIIVQGSTNENKTFVLISDSKISIQKADILYGIIKNTPDMKPELKNRYLKEIADLLSVNSKIYKGINDEEYREETVGKSPNNLTP